MEAWGLGLVKLASTDHGHDLGSRAIWTGIHHSMECTGAGMDRTILFLVEGGLWGARDEVEHPSIKLDVAQM